MVMKNNVTMFLGTIAEPVSANYRFAKIYVATETYYSPVEKPASEIKTSYEYDVGDGVMEKFERKDTSTITAQWIPWGNQNRTSSPMLTGGETVLVFRIAGIDKYFFTTFFNDLDFKAQDVVEYMFPSRPRMEDTGSGEEGVNVFKPDPEKPGNELTAAYKFIVDTSDEVQQIYLTTTAFNGERSILTANFDCKLGNISFFNDRGELLSLESSKAPSDEGGSDEDEPGRIRFITSGYFLQKSTRGMYQDLLDSLYTKITGNEFKEISDVALYRLGREVKQIKEESFYKYGDKVTTLVKGDYGVKTSSGNIVLDSGGDIGFTTLSGKMKVFSGTEVTVISPKVNFVSPAVNVTGTLTGVAISMGAAPSADNQPLMVTSQTIDWEKFDEEMEKVVTLNTIVPPEEEEKKEEKKEEEEKEEDKQPDNIDGQGSSQDAIMNMKGKFEVKAQMTASINGTAGTSLKGGGQDLVQILQNFVTELQTALSADLVASTVIGKGVLDPSTLTTQVTAVITPVLTQTIAACTKAMTQLTMFKGGASRSLLSEHDDEVLNLNQSAKIEIPDSNLELKLNALKKNLKLKKK